VARTIRFRLKTLLFCVLAAAILLWLFDAAPFLHDNVVVRFERVGVAPLVIDDPIEHVLDEAIVFYRQHKLLPWKRAVHAVVLIPHPGSNGSYAVQPTMFLVREQMESNFEVVEPNFFRFTRERIYPFLGTKVTDMYIARSNTDGLYECLGPAAQRWGEDQARGTSVLLPDDMTTIDVHGSYTDIAQFFRKSPSVPWTSDAMIQAAFE
jgi:hypothetical protein